MSETLGKRQNGTPDGTIAIPVRWALGEPVPTVYANQLFITHFGGEFYLVFGELAPTTEPGSVPECVWVKPVARIAVAPENMARMADAIRENVAKYRQERAGEEGSGL